MIEFEHLFQFVAFGMYGTLSKTAEILHVSQPTLTRNMKLLEKEFGVILFARSKNHIALNENGLLAIKEARKILSEIEVMTDKVRQLDRSRHTLSLGSCCPLSCHGLCTASNGTLSIAVTDNGTAQHRSPFFKGCGMGDTMSLSCLLSRLTAHSSLSPSARNHCTSPSQRASPGKKLLPFFFRFGRDCHDCLFPHRVLEESHQGNNAPFPFPAPRTER